MSETLGVGEFDGLGSGMSWPAGRSYVAADKLSDLLLESSQWHAHNAIQYCQSSLTNELLSAAISCGCAVELLAKSVLARWCPALLAQNGHVNSVLLLTGKQLWAFPTHPIEGLKSIGAEEAITRANLLLRGGGGEETKNARNHGSCVPSVLRVIGSTTGGGDGAYLPFRVRNAAIHMALVQYDQLCDAMVSMVDSINILLSQSSPGDDTSFWGTYAAAARAMIDKANSTAQRALQIKISAAQQMLHDRSTGLTLEAKQSLIRDLESNYSPHLSGFREAQQCPACANQGRRIYQQPYLSRPQQVDVQDSGNWTNIYPHYIAGFECPVCSLALSAFESEALGYERELVLFQNGDQWARYAS